MKQMAQKTNLPLLSVLHRRDYEGILLLYPYNINILRGGSRNSGTQV